MVSDRHQLRLDGVFSSVEELYQVHDEIQQTILILGLVL